MRLHLRLLFIAVLSFLIALNENVLRRGIALALCGLLGVNTATCYPLYAKTTGGVKAATTPEAATVFFPEADTDAIDDIAQFRLPDLSLPDIPLPGGGSSDDLIWGFVADQLLDFLGDQAPIIANTRDIFPTVTVLPGEPFDASKEPFEPSQEDRIALAGLKREGAALASPNQVAQLPRVRNQNRSGTEGTEAGETNPVQNSIVPFNPTGNADYITAQLHDSPDGTVMLAPGDYEIPVTLLCMNQRASSPPGHRYVLAPLQGSRASVIAALNARAGGLGLDYRPLQALSWNIQAGITYAEMPEASQTLVDRLIPDYREQLRGNFLQEIETTYNAISGVSGLPSFNAALDQLGDVGRIVREYQQFRDTLVRYQSNYNRLFDELIPTGVTTNTRGGAERTPWSRLDDRVYARMITDGSAGGRGLMQIRVLIKRTPAGLIYDAVRVAITSIIADSQTENVQSTTGIPQAEPASPPVDVASTPPNGPEDPDEDSSENSCSQENNSGDQYPSVEDPRTGRPIEFPEGQFERVPRNQRVRWTGTERRAFIREWEARGYPEPPGTWQEYEIHHILPKELGGSNAFENLVPLRRDVHRMFTRFWNKYIRCNL